MALIFPQDGDKDSGRNFSLWSTRTNITNYVEKGMNFNVDYTNNEFDLTAGFAFVRHSDEDKVIDVDSADFTDVALTDNATNHIFLNPDFDTNDAVALHVDTDATAPSGAYLKLGTIDTGNDTKNEVNRAPVVKSRRAELDNLDVLKNSVHKDDIPAYFGSSTDDFSVTYESGTDKLVFRDEFNGTDIVRLNKGGKVEIPNGRLDIDTDLQFDDDKKALYGNAPDFSVYYNSTADELQVVDEVNNTIKTTFDKSGDVAIPNGALKMGANILMSGNHVVDPGQLQTGGGGSDVITVRDAAGAVDIARFNEGGAIEFPNGNVQLYDNNLINPAQLHTSGGGTDQIEMYDVASAAVIARFNEGGAVDIPNGVLDMGGNIQMGGNHVVDPGQLQTGGGGSDVITVRDTFNAADITRFNEGGPVEFLNTEIHTHGNIIDLDGGDQFLTIHDGNGNYNLKSGIDENQNIVSGSGGTHISLNEGGRFAVALDESTAAGNAAATTEYLVVNSGAVNVNSGPLQVSGADSSNDSIDSGGHINFTGGVTSSPVIRTPGGGTASIRIYDDANATPLIEAFEGGPVDIRTTLSMEGILDANNSSGGRVVLPVGTDKWA